LSDHCFDNNYKDEVLVDAIINRINKYFQKLKIPYVSFSSTRDLMKGYGGYQSYIDIASKANTTFYILVKFEKSELGKKEMDAYFSNVNLTLECFDTENGLGIGSTSSRSGLVGSAISQSDANFEAARVVASKCAEEASTQMIEKVADIINEGTYYEIKLFNVRDYLQAKEFKNVLTGLQEFTGEIRMSNINNYYRFEVSYKCKRPDIIADKIFQESISRPILRTLNMTGDPGKLINYSL
jgi:ribosomal protein L18